MELADRIQSLANWGKVLRSIPMEELKTVLERAQNKNGWFTSDSCSFSLNEIKNWLNEDALKNWIETYSINVNQGSKNIGLVMAGNIPLVGFHDLLCVLISGHYARIKLSSQDDELLPFLISLLIKNDSRWKDLIQFTERLNNVDAVIATGSDNSARYFEHYFKSIPKIIRKNRTSVGVIIGEEDSKEYQQLARDIFTYFGMGCRNVSKLYIPHDFDLNSLASPFQSFQTLLDHNKYVNNYDYQKTIRIISSKPFHDLAFLLMEESEDLVSPIAVMYYQYYSDIKELGQLLRNHADKIQCVVSAQAWLQGSIPFGRAQHPTLQNYADNIDTLKFLLSI